MIRSEIRYACMAMAALAAGSFFTSCSDDDDNTPKKEIVTIGFENTGITLAGPTSYGANLYNGYEGTQFTSGEIAVTPSVKLHFGLNESMFTDEIDFYGGGMALSQWNYRSNPAGQGGVDWWYSYHNQCSVYNVNSTDGANQGAGADGSNTFGICFGYKDNNSMSGRSRLSFTNRAEFPLVSVDFCNSSYVYGTLMEGNPFGSHPDKNIKEAKGWFMVEVYGFDASNNPVNGGKPVQFYLCDYRDGSATATETISTWKTCDLSALGKVNAIEIDLKGSDYGTYGLNTPSYVCIDNLRIDVTPAPAK